MTSRPSTAAPILAVLAVVLVTLGAYVGGYFWLGEHGQLEDGYFGKGFILRTYRHKWQVTLFQPASRVESWWKDRRVEIMSSDGQTEIHLAP